MLTSTGGWAPATVVAGQEAVPPLATGTSPALLAPGLKDVLDSPRAHAAGSASGCFDPLDSARASHGACQPPASTSALRKSISMGNGLQRAGKTRRVSLLVGDVAVAPAAEDAEPRKDQQMELSLETTSQQSASQKGRNRRSRLMMPGGKSLAEDSIDDMAALATDSHWFSFRPKVIMPDNGYYMMFWYFTMAFAMANAILDPFDLAFGSTRGWEASQIDFWAAVEFIGTAVFLVDIVLKFFLAYEDEERKEMVTEFKPIAKHYLSFMFWMDVLFWFPFSGVILTLRPDLADGPQPPNDVNIPNTAISAGYYVGLLGFLKLGRLYRIFHLFDHLDHTMIISQMSLMLLRNFVYIMLTCHWAACVFYFIGRAEQYSVTGSWMGRHLERFQGLSIGEVYIYAFYLSVNLFAGLGDGDFFSASPVESVVTSIYLLFNVVLIAYILGTVTMLMVKGDERSKSYRDRISHLKDYYIINELPQELHDAMRAHLELHYQSEQVADEAVLSMYPSAIRRKVLRHLYLEPLRNCYLFKSCKPKFLDAVLANCRTDLFMPNVHLINEGDIVSELYMMIEGEVEVHSAAMRRAHAQAQARGIANQRSLDRTSASTDPGSVNSKSFTPSTVDAQSQAMSGMSLLRQNSLAMSAARSSVGTHIDRRSTSECFGEVAFFTEVPSTDSIWTVSVVRLLVLPRQAYTNLVIAYPNQVRSLVDELRKKSERDVLDLLSDTLDSMPDGPDSIHTQIEPWAPDGQLTTLAIPAPLMRELRGALPEEQAAKLAQLERVKTAVQSFCLKQDWHRVYEMLNAASKGEDDTIKTLMSQGVSAACTDCDARTPLILAAQEGKESTVNLLLSSGANPNALDVFGNSALISAIKHGHDHLIETLVTAGATLAGVNDIILPDLFESVMEGDLAKLVRYLRGRADPSMPNHDGRTPLHMAAAEGSLAAVRILLEAGADPNVRDRWGHLPVDDARKAHAMPVVKFLQQLAAAMADTEAAATPGAPGLAQGGSSLEQPVSTTGPGVEPVGLSLLNRNRKRRTNSALSLDAQAIAQIKAAQREHELARSMSGGSALSTPRAVTRQQSKASHLDSPVPTLATPSAMKHSPSTGRLKSVMLQTDSEQRREGREEGSGIGKFAEVAAMSALAPAEDSVASADLAAVSAMLRGASQATAFVSEASQPVFADEAPLFALDDFAMFAERLKEEKEHFERGLSQALSQASELQDGLGQEASQPAIQGTGEGAQREQARHAQQGEAQAPTAWPTVVKLPASPAQATLDSTETSSSASTSSPPGERGGEGAAAAAGQGKGREEDDALTALTAAAQALAVGQPDGGAEARTSAAGPPPRTSSPAAVPSGSWTGAGPGMTAAPSMRRSDSPLGRSPLGRVPAAGSPPPATAAPLGGRPALNPAERVRPSTSAVAGMGMGPIPAVLALDTGRRPNTQPAIGPPGAGPLAAAPPAGSPEPQGGIAAGDQPARPGSPLSFHMAQLMESMVHRAPEGSRRFSVMSQASSGRPSAGPQPVHWRDSPLFGSDEDAQQQP